MPNSIKLASFVELVSPVLPIIGVAGGIKGQFSRWGGKSFAEKTGLFFGHSRINGEYGN